MTDDGVRIAGRFCYGIRMPDAATLENVFGPATVVFERQGSVHRAWVLEERLLVSQATGAMTAEFAYHWIGADRILEKHPRMHVGNDWTGITRYDSACRIMFARWILTHRSAFATGHFLIDRALVRMAVQTACMVAGLTPKIYAQRQPWIEALTAARLHLSQKSSAPKT